MLIYIYIYICILSKTEILAHSIEFFYNLLKTEILAHFIKKSKYFFMLAKNRYFSKISYIHPKQTFLKWFYVYLKQKSLKDSLIYLHEKSLQTIAS